MLENTNTDKDVSNNSTVLAHRKAAIRWQKANKEKVKAQTLAQYHTDKLVVLYECPCDVEKKHNHHPDYSKPFEVHKLCYRCHLAEHMRLRPVGERKMPDMRLVAIYLTARQMTMLKKAKRELGITRSEALRRIVDEYLEGKR